MFHSVGLDGTNWVFSHISEPVKLFEEKIAALKQAGYHFIFWDDLFEHMAGRSKMPRKSVMLTFDDGYLDNWVFAFSILKKYGAKGTIFVNPEFVDPAQVPRPTSNDIRAGKISADSLKTVGFLNWAEMRAMEASGLIDIQSHALTHTWYFAGPKVKDFHRPGNKQYPWLAWNLLPERKPFYMTEDQSGFVPSGTPIYEHEVSLICRRYFPPKSVSVGVIDFVSENGGLDFFSVNGWREKLRAHHARLMKCYENEAHYETEGEYKSRVTWELLESKRLIEENLGKRVNYICWPGGGYNETVLALAREAGYRAWTLSSRDQTNFRNIPGANPEQIKRVGSFSRYGVHGGRILGYAGGRYFLCGIERHKGSLFYKWLGRTLVVQAWLRDLMRVK